MLVALVAFVHAFSPLNAELGAPCHHQTREHDCGTQLVCLPPGGGDWHTDPPYDESVTGEELRVRGVGPATQVAIFEATTEAPAPDAEAVAAWVGPAPERVWAA